MSNLTDMMFNSRCPICNGHLEKKQRYSTVLFCKNECVYATDVVNDYNYVDHVFCIFFGDVKNSIGITEENMDEYRKIVEYWKENDRYIAKILMGVENQ